MSDPILADRYYEINRISGIRDESGNRKDSVSVFVTGRPGGRPRRPVAQ
jgi:hypothetical protein